MAETFYIEDGVEVAPSPFLKPLRDRGFGSISELPEEELAGPSELEHAAFLRDFEPVLLLPKPKAAEYNPALDWSNPDFNAFLSSDFDKIMPEFDRARYKADKLKEELRDLIIRIQIQNEKIPGKAKYKVLQLVRKGIMDVDDISDWNLWFLAKFYLRAVGLKKEIARLEEASFQRRQKALKAWLDTL